MGHVNLLVPRAEHGLPWGLHGTHGAGPRVSKKSPGLRLSCLVSDLGLGSLSCSIMWPLNILSKPLLACHVFQMKGREKMNIALAHLPNLKASRSFFRSWGGRQESPSSEMEKHLIKKGPREKWRHKFQGLTF